MAKKRWLVEVWRHNEETKCAERFECIFNRKSDAINAYNLATYAMGLGNGYKPNKATRLSGDKLNAVEFWGVE